MNLGLLVKTLYYSPHPLEKAKVARTTHSPRVMYQHKNYLPSKSWVLMYLFETYGQLGKSNFAFQQTNQLLQEVILRTPDP